MKEVTLLSSPANATVGSDWLGSDEVNGDDFFSGKLKQL